MATTVAEQTNSPDADASRPQRLVGEWFWRFLAVVMLATVGWVLWIIYQINPQPLITNAGFAAAAKARASQDAKGVITQAAVPASVPPAAEASTGGEAAKPPVQSVPAEAKAPPVNVERLRFSDSIQTPIAEPGSKK